MGYVLLMHFSWITLGILAVLSLITLYIHALKKNAKIPRFITSTLRYYTIITTLFFEAVYIVKQWDGFNFPHILSYFPGYLNSAIASVKLYFGEAKVFLIILGVISILLVFIIPIYSFHAFPIIHFLTHQLGLAGLPFSLVPSQR